MTNYAHIAGVEVAEFLEDESDPVEQRHCTMRELYYDAGCGDLVLRFEDRDSGRYFNMSIPVKAVKSWNEFAESLPRWD